MTSSFARCLLACALGISLLVVFSRPAAGQHFSDCFTTTTNATVLVPKNVSASIGSSGDGLSDGDEIALFTDNGQCAGLGSWQNANLAIAIAGDNSQETSGYEEGQSFQFRVWDASAQTVYETDVTFASCADENPLCQSDGKYTADAFYELASLSAEGAPPPDGGTETVEVVDISAEQYADQVDQTIDDDLSTRWGASGIGSSIRYELSQETPLNEVGIAWYRGDLRRTEYEIAVSTDGGNWTTVHEGSSSGTTQGREYYSFPETAARYVRITGNGNEENNWMSITEVDIAGQNSASSSKRLATQHVDQPIEEEPPAVLTLKPNYPNPFNQSTTIEYGLPKDGHVILDVFDMLGRQVARLVDQQQRAGQHHVQINSANWTSGTYLYRLRVDGTTRTGRMTIVR